MQQLWCWELLSVLDAGEDRAEFLRHFIGPESAREGEPVHKFNDRPSAVARLWKALDRLTPLVVQPARKSAPEEPSATRSGANDNRAI